jgi:hypothetical protein
MNHDDILTAVDVADVRAAVVKTRRRVLRAAVATPILVALLAWLLVYYVKVSSVAISTFVAAMLLLLGVPVYVHWWRHYRSIIWQLDVLAQRVASGETVYGSKVSFHPHGEPN